MANTITDSTLANLCDSIYYSKPRATAQGAKAINILSNKSKKNLRLSTPLLMTYGASDYTDANTGLSNDKFNMTLAFATDENDDSEAFLNNMLELENKIKADALTNSKEWFGKQHKSSEVVDALWTPMVKYPKDKITGDYDTNKKPSIRVKMPKWDGQWTFEVFDEDSNKVFPDPTNSTTPLDLITYKSYVACIIEFAGIWFVNGKFCATWKLVQCMVQKPAETIQGKCFITLKKSDMQTMKQQQTIQNVQETQPVLVDDSDDEEVVPQPPTKLAPEEDDVVSPPVPPSVSEEVSQEIASVEPPQPKKKVVKKVTKKKVASSET